MNILLLLRWKSAFVRVYFISIQVCPGLQPSLCSFREWEDGEEMFSETSSEVDVWHPRLSQCFQCCASSLRWCLNLGQSGAEFSNKVHC